MRTNFRALVVREVKDNNFKRKIEIRNIDDLPQGEVLIRVHYSSLNYKDALSAKGHKGITRTYPHTPGVDAAGIVEKSTSLKFHTGDSVIVTGYDLGMNTDGGFAEYIRVPKEWVIPLPLGLSLKESMIFGTAGFTVGLCLREFEKQHLLPGSGKILVTGASGGVGSLAVLMLSKLGYKVTASTGKPEKAEFLKKLGAVEIISREEVSDNTNKQLLPIKWAGVIDNVGGNTLSTAIRSTQPYGVVASIGLVSSDKLETTVYPFILRGISLVGINSAESLKKQRRYFWKQIVPNFKSKLTNEIYKEVTLECLDKEIDLMLKGKQIGRVIVNLIE